MSTSQAEVAGERFSEAQTEAGRTACEVTAPRVVLAKVGLDGHDRGLKVVARGLRDAGLHVIYGGIWLSPEAVAQSVADEGADWLGISLLSGAHLTLMPRVMHALGQQGLQHVGVVLGGIVPDEDITPLRELGVRAVFGPGSSMAEIACVLQTTTPVAEAGDVPALIERCWQRDRMALSNLLARLAAGTDVSAIRASLDACGADRQPPTSPDRLAPRTIAFTGSAGVGKSTLIGRLIKELRRQGHSVAVLACDPQSPLTGGALLGDRIRMTDCLPDPGVFIRSLGVPSGSQGIAPHLDLMARLLELAGFDITLVETAGVGQGDVAVRNVADAVVVLLQPEAGDSVQWEKAGLLEVADLIVIHKSDLAAADRLETELKQHFNVPGSRHVPIVRVSAVRSEGLTELWESLKTRPSG